MASGASHTVRISVLYLMDSSDLFDARSANPKADPQVVRERLFFSFCYLRVVSYVRVKHTFIL